MTLHKYASTLVLSLTADWKKKTDTNLVKINVHTTLVLVLNLTLISSKTVTVKSMSLILNTFKSVT